MGMRLGELRSFVENGRVRHLRNQDEIAALWEKVEEAIGGLLDQPNEAELGDFFELLEIPDNIEEAVRTFVTEINEQFCIDLSTELPEPPELPE